MKKIGRQVLFLHTNEHVLRCGEGAFVRLRDGSILYAYTEYVGSGWEDHCNAQLTCVYSRDEGETWGEKRVLLKKTPGTENIMSVSLLRMQNGDIGLFYIQKLIKDGLIYDEILLRRSGDEGSTWSEPTVVIAADGYFVLNNDRVIRLSGGRLVAPVAVSPPLEGDVLPSFVQAAVSDDDGVSWRLTQKVFCPFSDDPAGLQEPGVIELPDGRVRMWMRTDLGFQFETFSQDGCETWSPVQPNRYFTSAGAPMQIKRAGKYTLAIFNPVAHVNPALTQIAPFWKRWGRCPYVCAVSTDGGLTFERMFYLEDDLDNDYCYPAVLEGDDYFLVAYYHSNGTSVALNSTKIIKVYYHELEERQ